MKMLDYKPLNDNEIELLITLPEGKTANELMIQLHEEVKDIADKVHGKVLKVNGRITTPMSAYIGHYFAHLCAEIQFYVPMEKQYILAVWH